MIFDAITVCFHSHQTPCDLIKESFGINSLFADFNCLSVLNINILLFV